MFGVEHDSHSVGIASDSKYDNAQLLAANTQVHFYWQSVWCGCAVRVVSGLCPAPMRASS